MGDIEHSYNSPYRIWRCPACGNPSGRAGHINAECAGAEAVEYVRADTTEGAVEEAAEHKAEAYRLRALMTEAAKLDPVTCRKWIRDALDPTGGR